MELTEYYLEISPQTWSGIRQLHADGCRVMPEKDQLKSIGSFERAVRSMTQARRIHRRAQGCAHCCKA